jgi:hypothetical protein
MSHGPSTLTVSVSEAQRLESETRTRLLKAQKLSLIVDLDQTIVHATVDPTVGEWMSDPNNPNWPALQGVSRFQLNDGPNLPNEGCYYYLKQRSVLAPLSSLMISLPTLPTQPLYDASFLNTKKLSNALVLVCQTSYIPWRISMRCTSIQWGPGHMPMLSVRLLIRQVKSSGIEYWVEMKVAVCLCSFSIVHHLHRLTAVLNNILSPSSCIVHHPRYDPKVNHQAISRRH